MEGMNDCMGLEGLAPLLLDFGFLPFLPVIGKTLPTQSERMGALALTRAEMGSITAELNISQALLSNLLPSTKYGFKFKHG